eukprot:scaffold1390_cov172-Amphora_coffeaeformis.AAC.1
MAKSSFALDSVNVGFLHKDKKGGLPLVISPRWDASLPFLRRFLQVNRKWIDEMLVQYGAILVRGFDINTAHDIQVAVQAYQPNLNATYRGTSPRNIQLGTEFVFSAAEVPTHYPIAQHLEMSFLEAPPKQLYFGCLKPSACAGGETSLCHFGNVYQDVSPQLKQKLLDKGLKYTRTNRKVGAKCTYDTSDMKGWPDIFETNDKKKVEEMCAAEGTPVTWTKDDAFVSTTFSQAFQLHPITNEPIWFNHSQVFHWTTFPAELWHAFTRTRDVRLFLHCLFVMLFCVVKYGILRHKMSLQVDFGDGSPISVMEMAEIRRAIHKNMVYSQWQKGDMIFIDNFAVSHGRQPTYDMGRKVVVAWAQPQHKANRLVSLESPRSTSKTVSAKHLYYPNPQEWSPPPSLTKEDTQILEDALSNFSRNPHDAQVTNATWQLLKQIVSRAEGRRSRHHRAHSQPTMVSSIWQNED